MGWRAFLRNPIQTVNISANTQYHPSSFPVNAQIILRNTPPVDINLSLSGFNKNILANSVIASLSTLDEDAEDNHTYSLVPGDGDEDNNKFRIQGKNLKIKESPDFEDQQTYSIRVQSEDTGGRKLEKSLFLNVNDINEDPVDINLSSSSFNDNTNMLSTIAFLDTLDEDAEDNHTYSLVQGDGDDDNIKFKIQGKRLKIKVSPDFEDQQTYSIRIQSEDAGGLKLEKIFTLNVIDINEKPGRIDLSSRFFDENLEIDSVVATISAIDPEGGSLKFELMDWGPDIESFRIEGNKLKIMEIPDYETKSYYYIHIKVSDPGGLYRHKSTILNVRNVEPEIIRSSESFTLPDGALDLVLTGSNNIDGTGNELPNKLTGNSGDNILDGKGGIDILKGLGGDDIYVINHKGDQVIERQGSGLDMIKSSVNISLSSNVENLELIGSKKN